VVEISTVAIIGAGISGRWIACLAALGGYRTILEDILPATLRKAEAGMRASLHRASLNCDSPNNANANADAEAEAAQALARIEYASTVEEAARQADLVIEAVPDELESKIEIFTLLDKICRPETILALNTATINITEIASVTYRPQKCIGMRFTNPANQPTRLELLPSQSTSQETLDACVKAGKRMAKEVVILGP